MLNHVETLRDEGNDRRITGSDIGTIERAREFTVEAAWALGAITSAEAKERHGVSI